MLRLPRWRQITRENIAFFCKTPFDPQDGKCTGTPQNLSVSSGNLNDTVERSGDTERVVGRNRSAVRHLVRQLSAILCCDGGSFADAPRTSSSSSLVY